MAINNRTIAKMKYLLKRKHLPAACALLAIKRDYAYSSIKENTELRLRRIKLQRIYEVINVVVYLFEQKMMEVLFAK